MIVTKVSFVATSRQPFREAQWGRGITGEIVKSGKVYLDDDDNPFFWHGVVVNETRCYVGFPGLPFYREMEEWHFSRDNEVEAVLRELAQSL